MLGAFLRVLDYGVVLIISLFAVKLLVRVARLLSFAAMRKRVFFPLLVLLVLAGCARFPVTDVTALKARSWSDVRSQVLARDADVEQFRLRGPFEVTIRQDRELRLPGGEHIVADLYLASPADKAPLLVLLHGHDNSKEDHAYQALHLASWGVHSMAVQLPNQGPWPDNGRTLARITALIRRQPELLDGRIDVDRIILAGHSFGGAAVAIALAQGAPAVGGILLDAAGLGKGMPGYLRKVDKPVLLLGADEDQSPVRDRSDFFFYIRRGVAEISITDASHEDATFRLEPVPMGTEDDPVPTEELQITFVSALTAAAVSLGGAGNLDYAWRSFRGGLESGRFSHPMRK